MHRLCCDQNIDIHSMCELMSFLHGSNNSKFNFYIAQFPVLVQSASHKKKKELIDKNLNIKHRT